MTDEILRHAQRRLPCAVHHVEEARVVVADARDQPAHRFDPTPFGLVQLGAVALQVGGLKR